MNGQALLYVYATEDEALRQELDNHLTSLAAEGLIEGWHAGLLSPGAEVDRQLAAQVARARVVVLLLSADFMASAQCQALLKQVHQERAARQIEVVPVLVRPVDWQGSGLHDLRPLPANGTAVSVWPDRDAAWLDVAQGIRSLVMGAPARSLTARREIVDFTLERMRHESFQGRGDVLAQLDRLLLGGRRRGYVLVVGSPGMGKSAILNEWLRRREQAGELYPHHFLRRGQQDWDQPTAVTRSLAVQIEVRYPTLVDPGASPERRLSDLLLRVSRAVLEPRGQRLILIIDGLDEAASIEGDNPLPLFLPWVLPPGVLVLCASRPAYPNLAWLKARDGGVSVLDLDAPAWSASNDAACRAFWASEAQHFDPPLPSSLIEEALTRGAGNLLYAVKLRDQFQDLSIEERRVIQVPAGLAGWLEESWERFIDDQTRWPSLERGLGLLCAAREALPRSIVDALVGGVPARETLLREIRPMLLEEPAAWHGGEPAYRPYHDSFREFISERLGPARMQAFHQELSASIARWPTQPGAASAAFRRAYALRHGIMHHVEAGLWREVHALCLDADHLIGKIATIGLEATEADLERATQRCPVEGGRRELQDVGRALRAESHWLRVMLDALPVLLFNRLVNLGWPAGQVTQRLTLAADLPLRLRHAVPRREQAERVLSGHRDVVSMCVISPDGTRALSASTDGTLRVWDLHTGRERHVLIGHEGPVRTCAISPDGMRALSGSDDSTLRVWDLSSGVGVHVLRGHSDRIRACAISADGTRALSTSYDGTLRIWEMESGCEVHLLDHPGVRACAISADGARSLSASSDHTLRVWDLQTGRMLHVLSGHSDRVQACAISPDGLHAVSASDDGTLRVWEIDTGRALHVLNGHSDAVRACVISPEGERALSASHDCTLRTWGLRSGSALNVLSGHSAGIWACAISPDGTRALSASADSTLRVWDLASGRQQHLLSGHSAWVLACAISPDGTRALSASGDGTLRIWEIERGRDQHLLGGHSAPVSVCAISPGGALALSASDDNTLRLWDLHSGREVRILAGHEDRIRACTISPDGKLALSGSDDNTLRLWDLSAGREQHTLRGHVDGVSACAISPDGKLALSASYDGTLRVWEMESGREVHLLSGHSAWVRACGISPDGTRCLSASLDRTLRVWDLSSGREIYVLSGHAGEIGACAISSDGARALSASDDHTLRVWDLCSGSELHVLEGHMDEISACAISPDGAHALSAAKDRTLRVWDLGTGRELHMLTGHSASIRACVISADGAHALSASDDRTLRLWEMETGACLTTVPGTAPFHCIATLGTSVVAGDAAGNVWFLGLGATMQ